MEKLSVIIFILPPLFAFIIHNRIKHGEMSTNRKWFVLITYFFMVNGFALGISYLRGIKGIQLEGMTVSYKLKYITVGGIFGIILPFLICQTRVRHYVCSILDKRISRVFVFIFLFCVFFVLGEKILTEKWLGGKQNITYRHESFYELPSNTLDYVVLGTSHGYRSLNPMLIYAQKGYTGYNLGSPYQPIGVSYSWLQEAYKTQAFKYCFFDINSLFYEENADRVRTIQGLTYMKPSLQKIKAAYECQSANVSMLEILFPMYSYHSRWKELGEKDFDIRNHYSCFKGAYLSFEAQNSALEDEGNRTEYLVYTEEEVILQKGDKINAGIDEMFGKIYRYCQKNGIELIPFKGPTMYWNEYTIETVNDYLSEYGLALLDMNADAVNLSWKQDTYDTGGHTNYWGNAKASNYLADFLDKELNLSDHRGSEGFEKWDNEIKEYEEYEENKLRTNEEKILLYLQILIKNKEDLCMIFSGREDVCTGWNDEIQNSIKRLGLKADFYNNVQNSYIGIVDGGAVRIDDFTKYPMMADISVESESGELQVAVESGGYLYGNQSKVLIEDQNYSLNNSGMNIVVIDKNTGKVISSASLGTNTEELIFKEKIRDKKLWEKYVKNGERVLEEGVYVIKAVNDAKEILGTISEGEENNLILLQGGTEDVKTQQFKLEYCGSGLYTIQAAGSGKYFTVEDFGNDEKTEVVLEKDTGLSNQKWYIFENEDNQYVILSHYNRLPVAFVGEEKNRNLQFRGDNNICGQGRFYINKMAGTTS